MRPDGVSGAEQVQKQTLMESVAKLAETVSATNYQIPNSLAGINDGVNAVFTNVNQQIKEFFENNEKGDNGESISANEQTQLKALRAEVDKLQNTFRNISVATDNTYRSIQDKILKIIDNIRSASEGVMPNLTVAQEPKETDIKKPNANSVDLKQLSNDDLIAEAEIIKSQFRPEGLMKSDYESCFTNVWGSGAKITSDKYRIIEGNLKNFQEKYRNELQNTGSSFDEFDNYSKIDTQISYYTELAERAKQKNEKEYINNLGSRTRQPSAEQARAWGKVMQKAADKERAEQQKRINEWLDKDS